MELTDYEKKVFEKLDSLDHFQYDVDYVIKADRSDRAELVEAIKKYITVWKCYEFNGDYTKFRRCATINRLEDLLPKEKRTIYDPTKTKI